MYVVLHKKNIDNKMRNTLRLTFELLLAAVVKYSEQKFGDPYGPIIQG